MKEADLQKLILEWLAYQQGQYWRMNTGAIVSEYKGKKRFFRFGTKGMSDIIGIHPNFGFVAIEIKGEVGKPTEHQKQFLDTINYWGGLGILAYSLEDVELEFLKRKIK